MNSFITPGMLLFSLAALLPACAAGPASATTNATGAAPMPAGIFAVAQGPATKQPAGSIDIAWNRYYNYDELSKHFKSIAAAHPELATVASIGKSFEGREMWVMTIHNPKTGPEAEKPAVWIDGNVHGNEVQGGDACVYLAWYVTEQYAHNPQIREIVDRSVLYILPSQNPDGRAYWFEAPNTSSSSRSGKRPLDSDRDGLADEDGAEDIDGDGEILRMRKHVPGRGDYRIDPDDPRRMIRVTAGRTGDYVMLGSEGIDNDGDGEINEDGPGGYDLNRNWPSDWQPNYIQFGAGDYPLSHPEARNVANFILAHPNIAAMQSFHNSGGMILRGPGASYVPEYPRSDLAVFDDLGLNGEKMLPFYNYMIIHRDLYTVHGGFVNWGFEGLGAYAITNELWADDQSFQKNAARRGPAFGGATTGEGGGQPRPRSAAEDESLQDDYVFDQLLMSGSTFVDWHKFNHPQYGEVELGGFRKMTGRVPPGFMIEEMLHRNALFCVYQASLLPKVEFEDVSVEKIGDDLFSVSATIKNVKRMNTRAALAAQKEMGLPDVLSISGDSLAVVSGGIATDRFRKSEVRLVEFEPARLLLNDGVAGFSRVTARWFVRGSGKASIRFSAERATPVSTTVDLK